MLHHFMKQFLLTIGILFRTIRAFLSRRLLGLRTRLRRLTNFSQQAGHAASETIQSAAETLTKSPSSRRDYIQTGRLLISKRFIVKVIVSGAVGIALLYFVIIPFIMGHFFTVRFYQKDDKLNTWSGRAIVYADPQKTIPLYEGKLENGLLQGKGTQYSENGQTLYAGAFTDGMRQGKGKVYDSGTLIYDGDFSADVYEGRGKWYYAGKLCYDGEFIQGVRAGEGTEYYYPSGAVRYKGSFANDRYDGIGEKFSEDGVKLYSGSFAQGSYNGNGTLYLSSDQTITANFVNGLPDGSMQWYKNGALYYSGGAEGTRPAGFGTLYAPKGEPVYSGQMANGTVDGAWLVSLTAQEFRDILAESKIVEYNQVAGGFVISAPAIGLSALCSYQTEDSEPMVNAVYLSTPRQSVFSLLPDTAQIFQENGIEPLTGSRYVSAMDGVNTKPAIYDCDVYTFENCQAEVLRIDSNVVALNWRRAVSLPETNNTTSAALQQEVAANTQTQANLEQFLSSLDQMAGTDSAEQAAKEENRLEKLLATLGLSQPPEGESASNAYYGQGSVADALTQCASIDTARRAIDGLLTYWEWTERRSALDSNLSRTLDTLTDAQNALISGTGSEDAVAALQDTKNALNTSISNCIAEMAKATAQVIDAGLPEPKNLSLPALATVFNPTTLDISELALVVTAYRQAIGAAEPEETVSLTLKTIFADLTTAYNNVQGAIQSYQSAKEATNRAAGAYAMGSGTKSAWYQAQSAQADSQTALYAAICAFTRQASELNHLTGGWVSRTQNWLASPLLILYDKAVQEHAASVAPTIPEQPQIAQPGTSAPTTQEQSETTQQETSAPITQEQQPAENVAPPIESTPDEEGKG